MFTSRAEYRLLLREDNADRRLCEIGRRAGLLNDDRYAAFRAKMEIMERAREGLREKVNPSPAVNDALQALGSSPLKTPADLASLLRRPEMSWPDLAALAPWTAELPPDAAEALEIEAKYEGYLDRQAAQAEEFRNLENVRLPEDMEYEGLPGLSREIQEKLIRVRPRSLGQASRISGVTPAALAVLQIWLKKHSGPDAPG
jgi:tRNA uridine 5-carboxymethylaminomethyl modification enzyme